jgi:peroxiredoxin
LNKLCVVLLIVVSCLAVCSCNKPGSVSEKNDLSAKQGGAAPDFTLKNLEGGNVQLSQYRGKIVLLEFWAPWCPPCKATIPQLTAVQTKYRERGVVVLGIAVDEDIGSIQKLSAFSQEYGINYHGLRGNETVERAYHVSSIPMIFLIDKEGMIVNSHTGYVDEFASQVSEEIARIP